ncbi:MULTISPECIES: glycosyltransferase family 9 protein [unclassified Duganella]|uniref:glycosyltransferase family 9 protein n=1 Tax=unclassified Duganella TaxID=2636909 RepID=UPI001E337A2E|nr:MULTISPECIES: glycosyltransferase family 9 protein [unclassified Duganella]
MNPASSSTPQTEYGGPLSSTMIFLLPALALSSKVGLGLVQLLILLLLFRRGPLMLALYRRHWGDIGGVVMAFGGYFLISLLRLLLDRQSLHTLDGPSRLLFGLSCIGVMYYLRPRARHFWLGLGFAAVLSAVVALYQVTIGGLDRAIGFTHHEITFGDLALACGLMSLCGLTDLRNTRFSWLPVVGLLCGLLASMLSASRGGWLALPLVLIPVVRYGARLYGRRLLLAGAVLLALVVLAFAVPATGVAVRIAQAFSDIHNYLQVGDANTSVGIRLELWKASWMMFTEHPWLGVGREQFDVALHALAAQGRLQQSAALLYSSSHNDMLNCLATGGLLDFSLLLTMYIAPLCFFAGQLRRPDQGQHPLALAGMVVVVAFFAFGLTDVMFWLMMPKVFYVMMVCSLVGMCLAAQYPAPVPRRILIARTDNIGDVVLTLPLAGYLKQLYPQVEVVFLCRRYAAAVVAQCRHVDQVLTLEELGDDWAHGLAQSGCDTMIFTFPQRTLAAAARRSGIQRRIGSSHRIHHWYHCNRLATFSRANSPLHEAQLNFKLLLPLGVDVEPPLEQLKTMYGLDTPRHPAADAVLAAPGFKLILHPKSNGNGREWPLQHYTALARLLGKADGVRVLVTGSAAEGELLAQQAPELLALPNVENLCGRLDLDGFTALIGGCDGLIASGTGPLHLASALGRPALGLFPPLKPIDIVRWGALGPRARSLCTPVACGHCEDAARCTCMLAITPEQVLEVVESWRAEALVEA